MMPVVPLEQGLLLAATLFSLGLFGVMMRRNLLFTLMSLDILLNAAALALVVSGAQQAQPDGQVIVLFVLAVAAAESAVGLALILLLFRRERTLDPDDARRMRG